MADVSFVRVLTSLERGATNALTAVLGVSMRVLTRVTGRGKHRDWRKQGEEEQQRRQRDLRP
jgi:hypothetical protein